MSAAFIPDPRNLILDAPKTAWPSKGETALSTSSLGCMSATPSGALTAGVSKQILNLTGPGVINFLGLTSEDDNGGSGRVLSVIAVIDGVTVINVSAAISGSYGYGVVVIGNAYGDVAQYQQVAFRKSCVVSIQSNLTETNKSKLLASYRLC